MRDIIERGLHMLRAEIINNSISAGQRATGRTLDSLTVEMFSDTHGGLWGAKHISVLEDGRRPGKVPYDFEQVLKEWAEAKGLYFSSYYMLAKHIRENGTKLYRDEGRNDIFSGAIENFKLWIIQEIKEFYKIEITNAFKQ